MPLIVIILFGILASSFALIFELLAVSLFSLSDQTLFASIPFAFEGTFSFKVLLILLSVAFIEETSKYAFLRQYARQFLVRAQISRNNALLLGTLFGLGFALLEFFFLLNTPATSPFFALSGTAFVHMTTSIIFALSLFPLSVASQEPKKCRLGATTLIFAMVTFHALYNLAVIFLS
jgi:hypothetical protein